MGPGSALAEPVIGRRFAPTRWLACPGRRKLFSRRDFARAIKIRRLTLKPEGAGNAGCTLHPRSRVPEIAQLAHTSIQVSGNTPTSPAQWLYGLLRALPGERAFFATVTARDIYTQLSASIAAPGPHDFAVRLGVFVRR